MTGNVGSAVFFVLAAASLLGGARRGPDGPRGLGLHRHLRLPSRSAVAGLFIALFPDVMPSSHRRGLQPDDHERLVDALHADVMTIVAVIITPIVLAYQAWTYWVFRKRISVQHIPQERLEAPVG